MSTIRVILQPVRSADGAPNVYAVRILDADYPRDERALIGWYDDLAVAIYDARSSLEDAGEREVDLCDLMEVS